MRVNGGTRRISDCSFLVSLCHSSSSARSVSFAVPWHTVLLFSLNSFPWWSHTASGLFMPLICRQLLDLDLQSRPFSLTPGLKYPTAYSASPIGCQKSISDMNKTKLLIFTHPCQICFNHQLLLSVKGKAVLPYKSKNPWNILGPFSSHTLSPNPVSSVLKCNQNSATSAHLLLPLWLRPPRCSPGLLEQPPG